MPHEPTEEEVESTTLDPRSYMAKSVPQRMAIISAGVIMNVIFAFLMASIAYGMGVRDEACGVSAVMPGEAAWRADLRPGDKFLAINDSGDRQLRFRDLMNAVALCDLETGIDFLVKREGVEKPFLGQRAARPGQEALPADDRRAQSAHHATGREESDDQGHAGRCHRLRSKPAIESCRSATWKSKAMQTSWRRWRDSRTKR